MNKVDTRVDYQVGEANELEQARRQIAELRTQFAALLEQLNNERERAEKLAALSERFGVR